MTNHTKALPDVVTALIVKLRELAGVIEDLQRQLKIAVCDLNHIQASLRVIVPDLGSAWLMVLGWRKRVWFY